VANRPAHEFESNTEYAALVYGKAPLLFDAQRKLVGDAAWLEALKKYVAEYRYRWVTADTFTHVVAKTSGNAKVQALKKRWWDETHGDEDVGGLDLGGLLGPRGAGAAGLPALDPAMMQQIEELMRQMLGQ
jgi:hypothetical protein